MDEDFPDFSTSIAQNKYIKTYFNRKTTQDIGQINPTPSVPEPKSVVEPLTTQNAVKFLLERNLKTKVCRYCLNVTSELSELDQVLQVGGKGALYKVTIKDMVVSFHPYKVADDPNFPNKICDKCLDRTISAYLFAQQCEQAERALRNCFEDINEKFENLDPLERPKKRGRKKLNTNHNILYAEHKNVIDYAEPLINIVNINAESMTEEQEITELECNKCWQVLPNIESLLNHEKSHPKSMWYSCRLCGRSFPKCQQLKRHQRSHLRLETKELKPFHCSDCVKAFDSYNEYLQHKENHKFKMVIEHLIERKTNKLCSVCLDKGTKLTALDNRVCLHGPYPELSGDVNLYTMVGTIVPDMNSLYNYTGRKICESCLNHAITSYVFIHRARYVRNRLNTCVTSILDNLTSIQPVNNIFVEISQNVVCPKLVTFEQDFLLNVGNDETKYPVDVLEDEFREESDSENEIKSGLSDVDLKDDNAPTIESFTNSFKDAEDLTDYKNDSIADFHPSTPNTLALTESMNGFREDVCSEFLTFNKKPTVVRRRCTFTCPVCSKRFISSYFFNRHVVRHINKKVQCTKCNDVFSSKFTLYEHTKMVHLLKTNHVSCTTCGRCFTSQHKLRNHEKYHKTKLCELCDKTFQSQAFYDSHLQRHQPKLSLRKKRVQTCSFCEKSCPSDNELSLHVNKAHLQIKPYSCDMCDRHFYTEYNLRCHKRVHSMRSKETCVFCSKKLNSRKQLVIHVRKHIGVKPYCCDVCGLSFYSQHKNGAHMKMSHGGRFCCRICKSVLTTRTALKDHVNVAHGCI